MATGGDVAVSSGASSGASSGRVAICGGDTSSGGGDVHVSSGTSRAGSTGEVCFLGGDACSSCPLVNIKTGIGPHASGQLVFWGGDGGGGGGGGGGGSCTLGGGDGCSGGSFGVFAGSGIDGRVLLDAGNSMCDAVGGSVVVDAGSAFSNGIINILSGKGVIGGDVELRSGVGSNHNSLSLRSGAFSLRIDDESICAHGDGIFYRSGHRATVGLGAGDGKIVLDVSDQARGANFALRRDEGLPCVVTCLPLRMTDATYSSDYRIKRDISSAPVSREQNKINLTLR